MAQEIERKFLLAEGATSPVFGDYSKIKIKQGYISGDKDKNVRIRLINGKEPKAILGIKFTNEAITDEFEYEIPMEEGIQIYEKTESKLEKKRISFDFNKVHYDLDIYPNGLQIIEAEFKSVDQMEKWVKPEWIGEDVSGQSEYSNVVLAKQQLLF